jgi:hypothetical protein
MKKLAIGLGAVVLLACLVFGVSNVVDFGRVAVDDVQQTLQDQVPISTKIAVMEKKIEGLDSKIDSGKQVVAEQRAGVKRHGEQVAEQVADVERQQSELYAMQDAYDASKSEQFVSVGGNRHEKAEVERNIETRFERLKRAETALKHDQELLSKEKDVLAANERALESLFTSKDKLELMVKDLRTRQKLIEARKVESMKSVDDSPTEDIMKLYEQIDKELSVEEELIEMEGETFGEIQVTPQETGKSALEEIRARRAREAADGQGNELINREVH